MSENVVIDELHVTVLASSELPNQQRDAIAGTVNSHRFRLALQRAIRKVFRRNRLLRSAQVVISR